MANYVITTNGIDILGSNLKASDTVYLFYKESDALKMNQVIGLLNSKAKKELIPYKTKDELMVSFAFLAAKTTNLTVLDTTIPVPELLKDKIKVSTDTKEKAVTKRTVKRTTKDSEKKTKSKETVPVEEKPKRKRRTSKVSTNTDTNENSNDDYDVQKEKLQKLLGITAEDIGYSLGTEFMIGRIITFVTESKTDEELRSSLEFNFRSDKDHIIADTVMKKIKDVRKIVH